MTISAALFAIIISGVMVLGNIDNLAVLGPNLAVCFLTGFYAVIIEFFLLSSRLNAEREMNKGMNL